MGGINVSNMEKSNFVKFIKLISAGSEVSKKGLGRGWGVEGGAWFNFHLMRTILSSRMESSVNILHMRWIIVNNQIKMHTHKYITNVLKFTRLHRWKVGISYRRLKGYYNQHYSYVYLYFLWNNSKQYNMCIILYINMHVYTKVGT